MANWQPLGCYSSAHAKVSSSYYYQTNSELPSVLWHCWLSIRKSIWPVKN